MKWEIYGEGVGKPGKEICYLLSFVGEDETERGEIAFVNFISGGMRQIEIIAIRTVNCLIFCYVRSSNLGKLKAARESLFVSTFGGMIYAW